MATATIATDNQHIACDPGIFGGKPIIAGTRIRVQDIYIWHELQGRTADEIVANFPQLTHADVFAALTYLWDHRQVILGDIGRSDELAEQVKGRYRSKLSSSPEV